MYRVEGVIRIWRWNQCVEVCPCEVCVCFAIVHVFWDGKDDDVVVDLHLQSHSPLPFWSRSAKDEADNSSVGSAVHTAASNMARPRRTNEHPALHRGVHAKHAEEDACWWDGLKVGRGERGGGCMRAILSPRERPLVGIEDVYQ